MPGLDGTGPEGLGPMTGGGFGRCNPDETVQPVAGRGLGRGRGVRGGMRGGGCGRGRGRAYRQAVAPADMLSTQAAVVNTAVPQAEAPTPPPAAEPEKPVISKKSKKG